jgi:lipopolysaccharide transport system permease protein
MTSKSASALEQHTLPEPPPAGPQDQPQDQPQDAARSHGGRPPIVIEPSGELAALRLGELWAYRELLFFMIWRDVKVRYKQTALGAAWVVLQPLATMLIFTIFFGRLAGLGEHTGGIPYPVFAYAALLPWTFFNSAVANSSNSLVGSAHIVTKVYFPRMIVPATSVGAALVDFAVAAVVFVGLMAFYSVRPTWSLLALPLVLGLLTLLAMAAGLWMSALNVKYRDVRYALPFIMQVWMFVSPIIYPSGIVPGRWRWLLMANPLTGIIEGFRSSLLGSPWDRGSLAVSAAFVLAALPLAARYFRRVEKIFADIV